MLRACVIVEGAQALLPVCLTGLRKYVAEPRSLFGAEFIAPAGEALRILAIETDIADDLLESGFNGVFTIEPA